MAEMFKANEVIRLAIEIEQNGLDFFTELAKGVASNSAKKISAFLAKEERGHIKMLEELLSTVKKYNIIESYPGEFVSYIKVISGEHIFAKSPKELAKTVKSDQDAINIGIDAEKDSILFYDGMKSFVPQSDHEPLEKIINEERGHLIKLYALKRELAKK